MTLAKKRTKLSILLIALAGCAEMDLAGPPDDGLDAAEQAAELHTALVDFGDGPTEVTYRIDDDMAVWQGDMILGPADMVASNRLVFLPEEAATEETDGVKLSGISHLNSWPGGRVRFVINDNVFPPGSTVRNRIQNAINFWNQNTVVRLVPRNANSNAHFVTFTAATASMGAGAGQAAVGYQPWTNQLIRLGPSVSVATVIHEIGHTVGLFHEQTRTDRDDHIAINFGNIQSGKQHNFDSYLVSGAVGLNFGPYDRRSRMHYGSFAFAINSSVPTIVRAGCALTSTSADCLVSPSSTLTERDIAGVTRQASGDPLKFRVRNEAGNSCLRPEGASRASGARVLLSSCSNTASRRWYLWKRAGTTQPMLINERSRMCLAADANNRMIQVSCTGATAHRYRFVDMGGWFNGDQLRRGGQCVRRLTSTNQPRLTNCANTPSRRWFKDFI